MAAELPPLPLVGGMDTWMFEAIKSTPISNGLAILIGCTNSSEHEPLRGVVRDLATLQLTFSEKLLFTTLCLNNPTVEHVKMVVKHTSELSKNALALPETWRRIVVTFSGHGDEKYLYTKDDHMCLREDIVKPLQAMKAKKLARLPKLFFIDACRGPDKDDGVYVPDLKKWFSDTSPVPRGGGRVSSTGNCFIAYSTLLGMQAFEDSNKGGFWIQTLAKELANHGNIGRTIQDVMTRVNKELNEICDKKNMAIQQPVTESTLAEDVKLLQEAQDLRQLEYQLLGQQPQVQQQQAAGGCQQHPQLLPQSQLLPQVFPLQQQPGVFEQQEGSQQQQQQHGVYQSQQEGYLQQPQQGGYHLPQQPQLGGYMSQQQQVPQWQQQLLGLRQQQGTYTPPQGYSSQQVGVFQQQQQQHLQQVAWDQQQGVQLQPGQLGPYQQQQHPQGPQQQGGMPVATYQSQQQLQQQGGIPVGTYQSQQQPQQPGGLQLPSGICDATDLLMLNLVADGRGPPGKAREVEARKAGPGNSKDDGLNDHSSSKIAQGDRVLQKKTGRKAPSCKKAKLKAYFESRGIGAHIDYETKPDGSGYKCTVYCPQVGYAEGDAKPTEDKAEQSAAKKALGRLLGQS